MFSKQIYSLSRPALLLSFQTRNIMLQAASLIPISQQQLPLVLDKSHHPISKRGILGLYLTNAPHHGLFARYQVNISDNSDPGYCSICKQPFTTLSYLNKMSRKGTMCIGCARLLGSLKSCPEKHAEIIDLLVLKTSSEEKIDLESLYPRLDRLAYRKIKEMSNRQERLIMLNKKNSSRHSILTPKELVEVMLKSSGKCAISGVTGHWGIEHHLKPAPLLLVFDHIIPVSRGGSFDAGNIQVVLNCINQVKGNRTDQEVRLWLKGLRKSHKKREKCLKTGIVKMNNDDEDINKE